MSIVLRSTLQPILDEFGFSIYYADSTKDKQLAIFTSCGKEVTRIPGITYATSRINRTEMEISKKYFLEFLEEKQNLIKKLISLQEQEQNIPFIRFTVFCKKLADKVDRYDNKIWLRKKTVSVAIDSDHNVIVSVCKNKMVKELKFSFTDKEANTIKEWIDYDVKRLKILKDIDIIQQKLNSCSV